MTTLYICTFSMVHAPLHIKQQDWEQAFGTEISGIVVLNKISSDWSSLDTIDRSLPTLRQPKRFQKLLRRNVVRCTHSHRSL